MNYHIRPVDFGKDMDYIERISREVQLEESHIREYWKSLTDQQASLRVLVADHHSKGVVGFCQRSGHSNNAAAYFIQVVTDPIMRHRGIGGKLYDEMLTLTLTNSVGSLASWVWADDSESISFARQRGFALGRRTVAQTLKAPGTNEKEMEAIVLSLEESGIRYQTLAEFPNDGCTQKKLYDLHKEVLKDSPGTHHWLPPFEEYQQKMFGSPSADLEGFILATHGDRWVGLIIVLPQSNSGRVFTPILGVIRKYRGQKIALGLRHFARLYRERRGLFRHTYTYDAENTALQSILWDGTKYLRREFFPLSKEVSH